MPNPYRHRVNYCLQEAGRALAAGKGMAGDETALFFLYRAYTTYLREQAEQLNLPDQAFASAAAVEQQLAATGRTAESLGELMQLEANGWAGSLLRQWQACLHPEDKAVNSELITSVAAEPETPLAMILAEFTSLLERQRMTSEEW